MRTLSERINSLKDSTIVFVIAALVVVLYGVLIQMEPVPKIMEARCAVSARECVEDGNWFVVTMNHEPRVRKPPLPTWFAAVSMAAAGTTHSIYVARLPVILMAFLSALFTYLFARRWFDKTHSLVAALVIITSGMMIYEGKRIQWDIFAAAFAFGGVWTLYRALRAEEGRVLWALGAVFMWALSIMSKGPVTLYSVMLPFLLALAITEGVRNIRWLTVAGVIAGSVVLGFSWYMAVYLLYPETFDILQEEVQAWHTRRVRGFYHYFLYLPLILFPWTAAFFGSLVLPFIKEAGAHLLSEERRRATMFFLVWFAASIVLVSLVPEKKTRYLLPTIMPPALLVASFIREAAERGIGGLRPALRWLWYGQVAGLFLLAAISVGATVYMWYDGAPPYVLIFVVAFAALSVWMWMGRTKPMVHVLAVFLLVLLFSLDATVLVRDFYKRKGKWDMEGAALTEKVVGSSPFYFYRYRTEKIVWAIGVTGPVIKEDTSIEEPSFVVIVEDRYMESFRKWAEGNGLIYRRLHSFTYNSAGNLYTIFRVKKGKN